jgi:hypothetical protein
MSEQQVKEAVLAKCQEAGPIHRSESGTVYKTHKGYDVCAGPLYTDGGNLKYAACVYVSEAIDANDWIWPLAAKILGVEVPNPSKDALIEGMCLSKQKESNTIDLNAYAIGLDAMYDRLYPTERPTNEMLWGCWKAACGYASMRLVESEFKEWLTTLPPDTLADDRELVLNPCQNMRYTTTIHPMGDIQHGLFIPLGEDHSEENAKVVGAALLRLCGKGVGNV